jgi:hypothetical protein
VASLFAQNQLRACAASAQQALHTHVRARHPAGSLHGVKTASPPYRPSARASRSTPTPRDPLDRATYARTPRGLLELGGRFCFRLLATASSVGPGVSQCAICDTPCRGPGGAEFAREMPAFDASESQYSRPTTWRSPRSSSRNPNSTSSGTTVAGPYPSKRSHAMSARLSYCLSISETRWSLLPQPLFEEGVVVNRLVDPGIVSSLSGG